MAITNYSDVEVKGMISSTKQGRLVGVSSTAITAGDTATGYSAGDVIMYNSTFYTVVSGKWQVTSLGNAQSITVDSALSTSSTNPVQNKVIAELVPSAASSSNQLADKNWVNSSISTNTANFKGTFDVVSDLNLTTSATTSQVATALASKISGATNNDYCFVSYDLSTDPGNVDKYERYKYNGSAWAYEYTLNNSSFTADQWAAINSGITSNLTTTLSTNASVWSAKQNQVVGGTGISIANDNKTINHTNSVTAQTSSYLGSATAALEIKYDGQGHITGATTTTMYPPTTAGTNGQVWVSQGSGVGKWVDQSTLSVGSASSATSATSATSAGSATNASYSAAIGTSSSHPQIGSATQPVYVSSAGTVTAGTALSDGAYKAMGSVSSGNTGLVTGGDIFTALAGVCHSGTISVPAAGGTVTDSTNLSGLTSTSKVIVGPASSSKDVYAAAGCFCTAQGTNSLTFTVANTASAAMSVNVIWFD